jgi:20S proteasome alpha/beta subunit
MSFIGTGYDLSASTYSPDGRIFQVYNLLSFSIPMLLILPQHRILGAVDENGPKLFVVEPSGVFFVSTY